MIKGSLSVAWTTADYLQLERHTVLTDADREIKKATTLIPISLADSMSSSFPELDCTHPHHPSLGGIIHRTDMSTVLIQRSSEGYEHLALNHICFRALEAARHPSAPTELRTQTHDASHPQSKPHRVCSAPCARISEANNAIAPA